MSSMGQTRPGPQIATVVCPKVVDVAYGLNIWKTAANILNKQWQTADKGKRFSVGLGRRLIV